MLRHIPVAILAYPLAAAMVDGMTFDPSFTDWLSPLTYAAWGTAFFGLTALLHLLGDAVLLIGGAIHERRMKNPKYATRYRSYEAMRRLGRLHGGSHLD